MKMYQVDAFTRNLFQGNPAAVLITPEWLDESLMQNIAMENNLSETAFVKIIDAENYAIRWFTPTSEVDFCGHATLASSFVLFQDYTAASQIHFHVADLGVFHITQAQDGKIQMNFPVRMPYRVEDYPKALTQALGLDHLVEVYTNSQAFIVLCEDAETVEQLQPDMRLIEQIGQDYARSVAVTAPGRAAYDCVSRYFAPHQGIPEDPVTGSLHTGVAALWAEKLQKPRILAYQASKRGGELECCLQADGRIEISGYAKMYMRAELLL